MSLDDILFFLSAHLDGVAWLVLVVLGYFGLGNYLKHQELQSDVQAVLDGAYAMVSRYRRQHPQDTHDWVEKGLKFADGLWRMMGKTPPPKFEGLALAKWTTRREAEKTTPVQAPLSFALSETALPAPSVLSSQPFPHP